MKKWQFLIAYKIFFALLVLTAITGQLDHSLQKTGFSLVNFFSYFTIESNLFAAAILLMSAYLLIHSKKRSHEQEMLRGAATLYMVTTGIIYGLLLSKAKVQITLPWVNDVLHRLFPLVMLFDWLYDKPTHKITARQSLLWLVFPVIYLMYSLIHGPLAHHWYPYPFIDVSQHGYLKVLISSLFIAVFVVALAQILVRLPKWIKPRR
jgi:hypothetical protein